MKKFLLTILVVLGIFSHQGCAADTQTTNNTDIQVSLTKKEVQSMERCLDLSIRSDRFKAILGILAGSSFVVPPVLHSFFENLASSQNIISVGTETVADIMVGTCVMLPFFIFAKYLLNRSHNNATLLTSLNKKMKEKNIPVLPEAGEDFLAAVAEIVLI